jgi:2-iminobutanoate/2-iminopropanoate deaminase
MERKIIVPEKNPPLNQTYSQGVQVGNLLFISGQIGFDPATKRIAEGGIQAQTRQCLENIRTIIEAAGSSMSDIIKMTVYVARQDDFAAMNQVYAEYFAGGSPPAKTALAVGGLAMGALVEMEAIALVQ